MDKEGKIFRAPRIKRRDPLGLFTEDTPFKQKIVKRKDQFQRRPKHRNRPDWGNDE